CLPWLTLAVRPYERRAPRSLRLRLELGICLGFGTWVLDFPWYRYLLSPSPSRQLIMRPARRRVRAPGLQRGDFAEVVGRVPSPGGVRGATMSISSAARAWK